MDKYTDFIVTAISTAVDKAIPTSKNGLTLIKKKPRLRRQYSQAHDPLVKACIYQLQKETKVTLGFL